MATTYRRVRSTRLLVLGLLVASLVAITVDARGGRDGPMATLGRGLGAVMGPLQEGVAAVVRPIGSFVTNVFRSGSLAEENTTLREEIAALRREAAEVNSLRRENAELRRLFGLSERHGFTLMGATVIAEAPGNFEWAVIIDKGAVDGVTVDMPVINAETEVQPGEAVETSGYSLEEGLGGVYPPSIQVGVVDSVEPDPSNLTLEVRVRPRVDLSRLSTVGVITGQKPLPPPEDADST